MVILQIWDCSSVVIKTATTKNYVRPSNLRHSIKTDGMNLHLNFSCSNSLVWVLFWNKMQKILLMGKPGTVIFLQEAWVLQKYLFPNDLLSRERVHDFFCWSRGLDIKEFACIDESNNLYFVYLKFVFST